MTSTTEYYKRIAKFDADLRRRSFTSHRDATEQQFNVSSENINEVIEGQKVSGCYLRATARVLDNRKRDRTLIFTQFVFANEKEFNLPSC